MTDWRCPYCGETAEGCLCDFDEAARTEEK